MHSRAVIEDFGLLPGLQLALAARALKSALGHEVLLAHDPTRPPPPIPLVVATRLMS